VESPDALVLVLGGGSLAPASADRVPPGALVVAADSGVDAAVDAGIHVDHVVGDLDSASLGAIAAAEAAGATIHRHLADKDATDSELALDLLLDLVGVDLTAEPRHTTLLVLGTAEGRLDHLLADVHALASPRLAQVAVTAVFGGSTVTVVRADRPRRITGSTGEQVSILPIAGLARGVTTTFLRWPLVDADLVAGTTRGLSNELLGDEAVVALTEGVVVVVQPGTFAGPIAPRTTPYDPTPVAPEPDD